RDNGASSDYLEEFNGSSEFRFTEGRGFWLLHKGKWNFSATVPSVPLNSGAVQIPLHSGWNIITNPYPFFITWQTVQAANSLSDPLWGFYGSFYSSYAMEPYNGYYFFNGSSLTSLTIPYGNSLGKNISDADRAGIEWKLPIRLESDSLIDASASLGVASTASNGWDKLDVRRPRAVGDLPAVVFVRPEWDDKFSSFATDFKPEFQDVQTWEFQVYVNKGKKGTLTVGELSQLPERFEVYLLDKERGKAQNLRTRSSYEFLSSNDVSQFELVVGSSEAIHERVRNVAPRSFSLSNNYPNPFNPVTTFEYLLPRAVHVSFKMYNLAGEEVAVLRSGYEESGEYVVRWDATGVPSGVYFARLVAGEFTSVKKVLLVK
ncbi:MAG: T9SS type A sorting domain-containing protein, partial [Bacteroidetes bacterium]